MNEIKVFVADLENVENLCAKYLTTLSTLAGADTFSLFSEIGAVASDIKANPGLGIDAKSVDAYSNLVSTLASAILSAYQQRKVKELIDRGGSHFEELLTALVRVSEIGDKALEDHTKTMLGSVPDDFVIEAKSGNPLLAQSQKAIDRIQKIKDALNLLPRYSIWPTRSQPLLQRQAQAGF